MANAAAATADLSGGIVCSEEFRVSSHRLADFAAAIGDSNPAHTSGQIAPPTFAHIPVMQSMVEVVEQVTSGFTLHGEHDFVFHTPIVPGQKLWTKSFLSGVRNTKTACLLMIRSETRTVDGAMVCAQTTTCLQPGVKDVPETGSDGPKRPDTSGVVLDGKDTYAIRPELAQNYAEAARDYAPYTMEFAAAAAAGFSAPLLHGMCTLALAARSIIDSHCGGDTAKLRRLGCRFSNPLLQEPGQNLIIHHGAQDGLVAFSGFDRNGDCVIRNGYAELLT